MNCARILVALCATGFCVSAAAQPYPARPVRIVVPFAAGSATDTVARVMGQNLSEVLGQP